MWLRCEKCQAILLILHILITSLCLQPLTLESILFTFDRESTIMHTLDLLYRRDNKRLAAYKATCTLKTCPIQNSYCAYRPSLSANAVLLALFSFSLCCFLLQAALSRRFIGFTTAMVSGCTLEVLGYIGRIMSWHNPFGQVCLIFYLHHLPMMMTSLYFMLKPIAGRFPDADCVPDHRPRLPGGGHSPDPLSHRPNLRLRKLTPQTPLLPPHLYSLRRHLPPTPGHRRRHDIRR